MTCIVPVYENAKSSLLSEQVSADIDPEVINPKLFRSRYAKFIVIGVKYNRRVCRRDREPIYISITIDINNISANLTSLEQDDSVSSINFDNEKILNTYRQETNNQ